MAIVPVIIVPALLVNVTGTPTRAVSLSTFFHSVFVLRGGPYIKSLLIIEGRPRGNGRLLLTTIGIFAESGGSFKFSNSPTDFAP